MSSLQEIVRKDLEATLAKMAEEHSLVDICREMALQSKLLFETERVRDQLKADPFEHFDEIKATISSLIRRISVTDFHSVTTLDGYGYTTATVAFDNTVRVLFRYERLATSGGDDTATVRYFIDVAREHEAFERLLWVQVWTVGNVPSGNHAKNLHLTHDDSDDDECLWSDIEEEDEKGGDARSVETSESGTQKEDIYFRRNKKIKKDKSIQTERSATTKSADDALSFDRFVAGVDPDLLQQFLKWINSGDIDDINAFFFLMTFPYYEQEFDIVGYLLEATFGSDDDEDESK
jgi:hypothetical protein